MHLMDRCSCHHTICTHDYIPMYYELALWALTVDDWTKIGALAAIVGAIVCAVPIVQWWLNSRIVLEVEIRAPSFSNFPDPQKPDRVVINGVVFNQSGKPVNITRFVLKAPNTTNVMTFYDAGNYRFPENVKYKIESREQAGFILQLIVPYPYALPSMEAHFKELFDKEMTNVQSACVEGAFVEITTEDKKVLKWKAKDVCEGNYKEWPSIVDRLASEIKAGYQPLK